MPRMISKKIQRAGLIDFTDPELDLHFALEAFQKLGRQTVLNVSSRDAFDRYIVDFFFDGITPDAETYTGIFSIKSLFV